MYFQSKVFPAWLFANYLHTVLDVGIKENSFTFIVQ